MATRFKDKDTVFVNSLDIPRALGKVYFYTTATSTPLNTYSDDGLTTPNTNPIILNIAGRFPVDVFLTVADYKIVITNSDGTDSVTIDPVHGGLAGDTVSVIQPYTGAVSRTIQSAYSDILHGYDFNVRPNSGLDDSSRIQAGLTAASATGRRFVMPVGVCTIATSLSVTTNVVFEGDGVAGPRVYANKTFPYGGPEIIFDKAVTDRTDPGSFALNLNFGAVGSEGIANTRVRGLGFSWTDSDAGGIYLQGATNIGIEDCHFAGGVDNYNANTITGFPIYMKDAIGSYFDRNFFYYCAYGIVAESYFNENKIRGNYFQNIKDICILLRGKAGGSIRSTIADNNVTFAKGFVWVSDAADNVDICNNTIEDVTLYPVVASATDYIDSGVNSTPSNIHVWKNSLIACNASGGPGIALLVNKGSVCFNSNQSPTGPQTALISVNSSSTAPVTVMGNDAGGKLLNAGDDTKINLIDYNAVTALPSVYHSGGMTPATLTTGTDATPVITETYICEIFIGSRTSLTGVAILNGSAVAGNVHVGLADSTGAKVTESNTITAQAGTAVYQKFAFGSAYTVTRPGKYFIIVQFSNASARFRAHAAGVFGASKKTGDTYGTFTTVTPPTTFTADLGPIASVY